MPSPDGRVDLRSDTVTTPTPAMRRAMADAEVGDDVYGEDPTVNRLEELAAARVGKEAAVYIPSGTMGNQIALRLLARPGTEVLCAARAHIRQYEAAAAAMNAGVQIRPLHDREGIFEPAAVDAAAEGPGHHLPPLSLVAIENTHMPAGGVPWPAAQVEAVAGAARRHGLPVHCDGARIFNAAVAQGCDAAALAAPVDTVMFCLSKGLSAPVGSMLAGSADLIAAARLERARLGGGMRQAGIIAAAGIVALTEMVDRLADDHARARRLAAALAERFPGSVDPDRVRTNIVCAASAALPASFLDDLAADGIRAGTIDQATVRLVTHKDVDDADLERALDAIAKAGEELMGEALTLLVDASSLLYRAFFSTPDSVRSPDGKPINAAHGFLGMLARLVSDHDPARLACAVDEDWRPTWRVELLPEYKASRVAGVATSEQTAADDEVGRQSVYVFKLLEGLGVPVVGFEACEAEDVIGTLAEREAAARPDTRVAIVSGDRDLYQLVRDPEIYVLYPVKGVSEMLRVDEAEVTRRYKIPGRAYADFAVLRGDPSDGLPGVKGIGEKTASSLLNTYGNLDEIIKAAQDNPGAGALSRVAAHLDYVERARQVVAIPRDLPLPDVDLTRPRRPPIPEVTALADALALDGAVGRLAKALEGTGG